MIRNDMVKILLRKLYDRQFKHWNVKLLKLCWENAESLGRAKDKIRYAIYWNHKRYAATYQPFAEVDEKAYCLPLNPHIKEYADRMEVIAEELDELWDERYEAERYLTNLFSFDAPPKRFEQALGATLFRVVQPAITRWFADSRDSWSDNNEFGMKTFVEANAATVRKMNERVMINLVTV